MEIEAISHGTGVITEFVDKGASFAIDLEAKATARLLENRKGIKANDKTAKDIAKKVLKFFGYEYGLEIKTESEIPEDMGFGEKEAIATATALSVAGALAKKHGSINKFKIDLHLKDQFMIIDEKLVDKKDLIDICTDSGMRFDRIYASFYGGFVVADNKKKQIFRRGEMEILQAIILIPNKPKKTDEEEFKVFEREFEIIFQEALKGNLNTAMRMNSALYDREITKRMISAEALAVSRSKEGGFIGLVRDNEKIKKIKDSVKKEGKILVRDVMNQQAMIQIKPKRIYKINEFMKLKGDHKYHWL